ncbi:putative extracellular matrix protein [Triangularia verruculosa]|uniref:Extracellular matrix protein n=1 Tax=Triangularia verruculosa TaxID=2587418 RepID=A0AAN7AYB9_9PEZI|nr:putative extracellular matrix protein [Triangularia verruculosa]
MKYSVATVFALATAVLAKPKFTNSNYDIVAGEPFTLKWDSAEGNVKIFLYKGKAGDENSFKPVETLATSSGATGTFTFTPTSTLNGDYAFVIEDESEDPRNFSPPFSLEGTAAPTTSASVSITSTSSTASSTETETESSTETGTETSTETSTSASSTLQTSTTVAPSTTRRTQTEETAPPNTNNGQRFASSLALVLGTVAALVFFN